MIHCGTFALFLASSSFFTLAILARIYRRGQCCWVVRKAADGASGVAGVSPRMYSLNGFQQALSFFTSGRLPRAERWPAAAEDEAIRRSTFALSLPFPSSRFVPSG